MSMMSIQEVAEFLGVQETRIERLEREHLLIAKGRDDDGKAIFDRSDVERYKELSDRLGGL